MMNFEGAPLDSQSNTIIKSALKFISGETKHVCWLCFAATDEEELDLQDCVRIQRPYIDVNVSFMNMLLDLGVKQEPLLPQTLCLACGTTVMNSYLFRHLCEYSNRLWVEAMDKLESSLQQTKSISSNAETLYLKIDERTTFSTKKVSKIKAEVVKSLNLMTRKSRYKKKHTPIKSPESQLGTYICEKCGKNCTSKAELKKHYKQHKEPLSCSLCDKSYNTLFHLQEHVERVHEPKKITCKQCPKKFGSIRLLRTHENYFHNAVVCRICSAQVPNRRELQRHAAKHINTTCPQCNKTASTKNALRSHMKTCGQAPQQYICDFCQKTYVNRSGIIKHMMIVHRFGNPLSCNWCDKKFDSKSNLKSHIITHTGEKNFFCEICGGRFVSQAALLYHTRIHTGERPYPCELCDRKFLSASRRMEHMRRRHWAPTKKCPHCPKMFADKPHRDKHARRHYNPKSKLFLPTAFNVKNIEIETF